MKISFLGPLFLLTSALSPAAIALVQTATASNNNTPTVSVNFTATPTVTDTVLVGVVSNGGACGIQQLTDNQAGNGNVYARLIFAAQGCGTGTNEASLWCAPVQFSSGTFTITASQAPNNGFITVFAVEYSGLSCNGDQAAFGVTAASPYACGTYTTTNANDLLVSVLSLNSNSTATATPPTGYTTQVSQTNPAVEIGFYADQVISSTAPQVPVWVSTTPPFLSIPCVAVALKAATGGGGGGGPFGYPR